MEMAREADIIVGDYNYAFDPSRKIGPIADAPGDWIVVVDEAHHLLVDPAALVVLRGVHAARRLAARADALRREEAELLAAENGDQNNYGGASPTSEVETDTSLTEGEDAVSTAPATAPES